MALAHGSATAPEKAWLTAWPVSIDAIIALAVAAVFYIRGTRSLRHRQMTAQRARHWAFFGGLAAIFFALATPLDVIAEHLFVVHQVQHLLLRGVAPMLLMLAVPAGPLIAGMPTVVRHRIFAPIMRQAIVRAVFGVAAQPLVSTVLYAGTLYAWQVPALHNVALLDGVWHCAMHLTMLGTGLIFFGCVFDPRPAPWGPPFHQRLVMLGAAMFANIPLGAITTLKERASYTAYDQLGRWWGVEPLTDELLGGLVIWIVGSMMGLLAVLWLLTRWSRSEERMVARRQQGFAVPHADATNPDPQAAARSARGRLGWSLVLVPLAVGMALVTLVLWTST